MSVASKVLAIALLMTGVLVVAALAYVMVTGLRAQPEPGPIETRLARAVRSLAIPRQAKGRANPVADSSATLTAGLEHFARYCAMCHGNNGSGQNTAIGRGLFPKPPDMRTDSTQNLADGELFYIIENGVRFTGMPAFGSGTPNEAGDRQTWQLVRFIRHLPSLTPDEIAWMESLNPL